MRYIGAIVITLVLLSLARSLSVTHPKDIHFSADGLTIKHTTVKKIIEGEATHIPITIQNPQATPLLVTLNWTASAENVGDISKYDSMAMVPLSETSANTFCASLPKMSRGSTVHYFIKVEDTSGKQLALIPPANERPIKLKYMDKVPPYIVIPHVFLMFIAVYFATLAFFDSIKAIGTGDRLKQMGRNFKWATVAVFLGGYPFGWAMNWFAFGSIWEGIPFGWDFTDNKTQIVLLYLIFLNVSMLGTLYENRFGKSNYSDKALGWFGLIGYLMVLAIYLIPHSIQFSIPVTAIFSYGLTAIIISLYIIGLIGKKRWIKGNSPSLP